MTLYSKANLMVKGVAHKDPAEEALNRVQLEADGSTVASNGTLLMAVGPVHEEEVSFPDLENEGVEVPAGGVGLRLEVADEVVRNLPKGKSSRSLDHALVVRCDEKRVELATTDMVKEKKVAARPARGAYPEWRTLLRRARGQVGAGRVCVNKRDLIQLLAAMDKACPDPGNENPVYIEFGGAESDGIILRSANYDTGQRCIGYIMPLDTGGQWLQTDDWEQRVLRKSAKRRKKAR